MMKRFILGIVSFLFAFQATAQTSSDSVQYISKLEIGRKKSKVFSSRDSSLTLIIDTLIMKDKSKLAFYGKKDVTLTVKHAVIGKRAFIFGTDGKNNGSELSITIGFDQLGTLLISTAGLNASNGFRTFPNGNGGNVTLHYLSTAVIPQFDNKKQKAYINIETKAGGYNVNPQSEIGNILSQIGTGSRPLGRLPQGQIYSGSSGVDGKVEIKAIDEL